MVITKNFVLNKTTAISAELVAFIINTNKFNITFIQPVCHYKLYINFIVWLQLQMLRIHHFQTK